VINPTVEKTTIANSKPVLTVLIDNSASTKFFKEGKNVKSILKKLKEHTPLNSKFNLHYFSFGKEVKVLDSLTFNEPITTISKGIDAINELYKKNNGAIVLLSDGNQTNGFDYEFINSKLPVSPLVIGDTIAYKDIRIHQLNVNKYSYLKNKFPVEIILLYEGTKPISTQFSIYKKGKKIFTQTLRFSAVEKSKTIRTNLTARSEGLNFYKVSVEKLENEKNTQNNSKYFSVEVINEQTKVALISSILHPDLGVLKRAIESNKQRDVTTFMVKDFENQTSKFQLVILYQPNNKFNSIFKQITTQKLNYLLVSGASTDWSFINKKQLGFSKKAINETENYGADYQDSFLTFFQKDIGFNNFPPLKDKFGEVSITKENQKLLHQRVFGIQSQQPLLATFEQNKQKAAVIFGEGIWKWRAVSFLNSNSFQDFDEFVGSLIQYLASNKKRNRLVVSVESMYASNETISISAFYTDKNFQFDKRASLLLSLTNNDTKEQRKLPFSLAQNAFQVAVEGLAPGNYHYEITVEGQRMKRTGGFLITESNIEEQFTNANSDKLTLLADRTGGKRYYPSEITRLIADFVRDDNYTTTQKSITKEEYLIDRKWI
jgi:hypothetical protein